MSGQQNQKQQGLISQLASALGFNEPMVQPQAPLASQAPLARQALQAPKAPKAPQPQVQPTQARTLQMSSEIAKERASSRSILNREMQNREETAQRMTDEESNGTVALAQEETERGSPIQHYFECSDCNYTEGQGADCMSCLLKKVNVNERLKQELPVKKEESVVETEKRPLKDQEMIDEQTQLQQVKETVPIQEETQVQENFMNFGLSLTLNNTVWLLVLLVCCIFAKSLFKIC